MSEEQITKKVIEILRGYVKDVSLLEKATAETHILKDLKVNSARLVDIIIKCEDVFGTSIDDEEAIVQNYLIQNPSLNQSQFQTQLLPS